MTSRRSRTVEALESLRPRIEADTDGLAFMLAVAHCAMAGIPMPVWLAGELTRRVNRVFIGGATSWDDAFGKPWPKNRKVAAHVHRRRIVIPRVSAAIRAAVQANPAAAVDKDFWEGIGVEAGVSATAAENAYRASLRMFSPSIQDLRAYMAISKAAVDIYATAPERPIDDDFFAEVSARAGVPHEVVAAWFRSALDKGLTFSPEPPMP
jgi:hypothetical protein